MFLFIYALREITFIDESLSFLFAGKTFYGCSFLSPVPKNIFSELLFFLFLREHPHDYKIFTFFYFCNSLQCFLSSICRNKIVYSSICRERNVSFPISRNMYYGGTGTYNSISPDRHATAKIRTPAACWRAL